MPLALKSFAGPSQSWWSLKILALLFLTVTPLAIAGPFDGWPDSTGAIQAFHKPAPAYVQGQTWKASSTTDVSATVTLSESVASITPYHLGANLSWWMGKAWALDSDRLDKARQAGIHFWRFPGGSSSDEYAWDGIYGKYPLGDKGQKRVTMNLSPSADTDAFIEICHATQAQPILTANYGMARYGNLDDALQLAKSWVLYTNVEKKFKVQYWEIGNEVYGDWEIGHKIKGKPDLDGKTYGRDFRSYAKAMKSIDPDIYLGAVAVNTDDGGDFTGFHWWMRDMLPEDADVADYLVLHEYFMWPFASDGKTPLKISNDVIFSNAAKIGEDADNINAMVLKYGKRKTPLPIALTEFNILNGIMPQTLELINALFTAEVVGEAITHGIRAVDYWDWKNGYDPSLGGGDHAMLSEGEPGLADGTPRPSYYAYALLSRALGDTMLASHSSDAQLKIYASRFEGGEMGLVLVNEKPGPVRLRLSMDGFQGKGRANVWSVSGENLNSKKVAFNGQSGPGPAGGPFPIDSIAPYSLDYKAGKPLEISLPGASLVGMVLY